MSTAIITTEIPTGTWEIDPVHSNASFEVEHSGVSIFRGAFKPITGRLVVTESDATLEGSVRVESITIDDENMRPHLLSPEFFGAEHNPEVRFRSTSIEGSGDALAVSGELELAGVSRAVRAQGRARGPVEGPGGTQKLALALETVVDRTDFGMNWQTELPSGGVALANDVKLIVELELNRS